VNLYGRIKLFTETARKNFYDIFFGMNDILAVVNKHILITNGEISEINIEEDKSRQIIAVTAKAKMEIANKSEILITLVNPRYFEQAEIKYFAKTKENCWVRSGNLYSSSYAKSLFGNDCFSELVKTFEEGRKPENVIISLDPEEKFSWNEVIHFEFHTADTKRLWQGVSWKEFRGSGDSFWFRLDYRLPSGMFSLKPKLFEVFPDAWKTAGEIPIARYKIKDISGQKISLETAPIFIDFTQAKVKTSKDNDER